MPRIIHLSDLHFGDSLLTWEHLKSQGQVFSKQFIGWANHRLNPKRHFGETIKTKLVERLLHADWDLLIITGDLVHLGSDAEFDLARNNLELLIKKGPVLLTAGNHDRYTPQSLGRLEHFFGDCYPFDQPGPTIFQGPGDWGFLELPQSAPTLLGSKGKFSGEFEVYQELILSRQGKPTVLYGHYPLFHPTGQSEAFSHRLWGAGQVAQLAQLPGVKAYLHGHMHKSWAFQPPGSSLWSLNAGGSLKEGYWSLELEQNELTVVKQLPPA